MADHPRCRMPFRLLPRTLSAQSIQQARRAEHYLTFEIPARRCGLTHVPPSEGLREASSNLASVPCRCPRYCLATPP